MSRCQLGQQGRKSVSGKGHSMCECLQMSKHMAHSKNVDRFCLAEALVGVGMEEWGGDIREMGLGKYGGTKP